MSADRPPLRAVSAPLVQRIMSTAERRPMRAVIVVVALVFVNVVNSAEMLPGLVFTKAELPAECEFVSAVEAQTEVKRAWLPAANYRPIVLRRMLIAAHEKGANHVLLTNEHAGTAQNPFVGYSMTGDAYKCPGALVPPAESKPKKRAPSHR